MSLVEDEYEYYTADEYSDDEPDDDEDLLDVHDDGEDHGAADDVEPR